PGSLEGFTHNHATVNNEENAPWGIVAAHGKSEKRDINACSLAARSRQIDDLRPTGLAYNACEPVLPRERRVAMQFRKERLKLGCPDATHTLAAVQPGTAGID